MFAKYETPICPHCGNPAVLTTGKVIYPRLYDLWKHNFWRCAPCDAFVGCHRNGAKVGKNPQGQPLYSDGTLPLGRLANADLRKAKQKAHGAFDRIWKSYALWAKHPAFDASAKHPGKRRTLMYAWLAKAMGIPAEDCHIGMFTEEQCLAAYNLCRPNQGVNMDDLSVEERLKQLFEAEEDQDFNEWETGFMETMRRVCKKGESISTSSLSPKQIDMIDKMFGKYCE